MGQTTGSADPLELRFTTVPRQGPAIQAALDELRGEISDLTPTTTQPAASQPTGSQPASKPAEAEAPPEQWQAKLRAGLVEFEGQLRELLRLTRELDQDSVDQAAKKLTDQIAEWRSRTADLARADTPMESDEIDKILQEIAAGHAKANQRLETVSAAKMALQDRVRDGSKKDREKLNADLSAATAELVALEAGFASEIKAADSDLLRDNLLFKRRSAHARVATLKTRLAVLDVRDKTQQQELERLSLEYEALKPYAEALTARKDVLQEAKSQSRIERLRRELGAAGADPVEKQFIRLQLIQAETISKIEADYAKGRQRFGKFALQELDNKWKGDRQFWKDFEESLGRRSAADVLEAYEQAQLDERDADREHRKKQAMLDMTFIEQRELEELRRAALKRFDETAAKIREQTRDTADPETLKRVQQISQLRTDLNKAFEDALKLDEVRNLLRKAVDITRQDLELWRAASRRLYWSHLITPAPSYFQTEVYAPVRNELRELRGDQFRRAVAHTRDTSLLQVQNLQRVDWIIVLVAELAAMAMLVWMLKKCRSFLRIESPAIEASEAQAIAFLGRLRPRIGKAARWAIPFVSVAVFSAVFILATGLNGTPKVLGWVVCGIWATIVLFPTLLYVAFHASKPRFRVIPCSSVVARHYVRFGYLLLLLSVLFLVPLLLLWALDLAPASVELLVQAFQFFATLLLLVFLFRREAVLNLIPRTERGRLAGTVTLLQTFYPLMVLLLISLIVLRLAGYAAMSSYVTVGLAGTLGAILVAWVVYIFFRETLLWMIRHTRRTREAYAPPPTVPPTNDAAESISAEPRNPDVPSAADQADTRESPEPLVETGQDSVPGAARMTLSSLRWLLGIAAMVLALYVWGLRPYELKRLLDVRLWEHGGQDVTLWRIGGAVLAIMIAVFVSRGIRQTLRSKLYPAHPGLDVGVQAAIDTLLHYVIVVIGIYAALQTLRLDFGALAVLFGGLGLGLGLGLQPLIVNFISGLIILFERHVKVGDVINLADKQGEVVRISMRSTLVRTGDGLHIIVPNGEFINQKVENWTLGHQPVRGVLDVVVAHKGEPDKVRGILLEIARRERLVLRHPPPEVAFKEIKDSGITFAIAGWFRDLGERAAGLMNIRYAISERLGREGMETAVKSLSVQTPGQK